VLVKNDYKIKYGLKIKLHGTNAAVRIEPDGKVVAQKRSSDLVGFAENAGFRAWVEANERYFASLALSDATLIVYGEWAGPGVQSGVALDSIPKKHFFPFAIDRHHATEGQERLYCPEQMEGILGSDCPNDIIVIPWHSTVEIDFVNKIEIEKSLFELNRATEAVGLEDPFIKDIFGTSGCGEGFVCYPFLGADAGVAYSGSELEHFSHFNFKSKSEHHRVNKTKAAVAFDPEKFANKNRFADSFCTEQRMEQGFREFVGEETPRTMKETATFIKWVCSDVHKESKTEMEAFHEETGLTWADISKVVSSRAALWYKEKISKL
jgi:hypothetical protein